MCGIAGFIDATLTEDERVKILAQMRESMRHRGPDEHGQITDGPVGLAMQRLSIVDLALGHQPMSSEDSRVWLVFNGEIYNHNELRRRLEAEGRCFRTRSDTEVVLAQYEQYGLEGIQDLNGMFAFAIWDGRKRQLHLVRDRMGVKPLYYYTDGSRFYFASELKCLAAATSLKLEVEPQAIWDYLTFRYVPAPGTIWQNVYKLPPAHNLTVDLACASPAPQRYWDSPYVTPGVDATTRRSKRELLEEFTDLFVDSVHIRMLADVPVGLFLSGGLDSSAVAAAVQRDAFPKLKTFSVSLEDAGDDDERPYARAAADYLQTDHRELVISADEYESLLTTLPWHTDEPLADPTCIPVYLLSKMAREDVKVVLSGEGADEIFAGYSFDSVQKGWDQSADSQLQQERWSLRHMLGPSRADESLRRYAASDQRTAEVPLHITNFYTSADKAQIWQKGGALFRDSTDVLRRDVRRVQSAHPLHQALYLYTQNWLVEDLLMKADKMTMAASLELRTPFLDYRLVEWAARAPASIKVENSEERYITKDIIREFAKGVLPPEIIQRPKKGFPVPVLRWLSSRLQPLVCDMLGSRNAKCCRWIEPGAVANILKRGTADEAPMIDRHHLWNLLVLELWLRTWLPCSIK